MRIRRFSAAVAVAAAALCSLLAARGAGAQTAEGTSIRNVATVSFSDANGNSYAPRSDTSDVTVGFSAGLTVTSAAATASPASPSAGDTLTFRVRNVGNGTDSVTVGETVSAAGVVTVTGYVVDGTSYGTLAALNAALSGTAVAAGDSLTVRVVYSTAAGRGGVSTVYTLSGTSRRSAGATASRAVTVTPAMSAGVAVSPKGGQSLAKLPSNGTNYTFTFTLTNNGSGPDDFDLRASRPGAAITIVSVDGAAGDSARVAGLAAGASRPVAVVYSVADVGAGAADTLRLRARSVAAPASADEGFADLTVVRVGLTITTALYRDNQTTALGAGDTVVPGEHVQYKVTVTNSGGAPATAVHVTSPLAPQLTHLSTSGDAAGWTFGLAGGTVAGDLAGTMAPGAARHFWVRVRIN